MLIDAAHPEETRVAVVADGQIEDFDFEAQDKRQLRGNIYLAKVTRVEPSLQAAFVEYGGNRHGFLAFSEIHPDYYQIPLEDREALIREQYEAAMEDDDDIDEDIIDVEAEPADVDDEGKDDQDHDESNTQSFEEDLEADEANAEEKSASAAVDEQISDTDSETPSEDSDDESDDDDSDESASVRKKRRHVHPSKRYKIQEVIKRRQVMLIQVVKEERGNKGAAVTTYLSLAGRYGVLMPNTARGGGISRKITNASDRKRLKSITKEFDIPDGMGLIIRTAGAKRTKAEISRDYDYLLRLWKTIRDKTLKSTAPCLIHEEGDLVLRAVRDFYDREVGQIVVQGDDACDQAREVVEMLMPDQTDLIAEHKKKTPLFINYGVEAQLDNIFSPVVNLPSGGYIVINQTEALVAIDVNSGKATRERNIETTALKTNIEAAVEACRQMRLRDLAGLIVIDFIDMEENKNNRAVEKKMKECLTIDRARVQAGRISQFGLFEISRQRRRAGVLELSSEPCPHCSGTGRIRSLESAALQLLRAIGERCADPRVQVVKVQAPKDVALYILNHKRSAVTEMEEAADVVIRIAADDGLMSGDFDIEANANGKVIPYKPVLPEPVKPKRKRRGNTNREEDNVEGLEVLDDDQVGSKGDAEDDEHESGGKRRRGRRGGRRRRGSAEERSETGSELESISQEEDDEEKRSGKSRRRRRRTRRRTPDVAVDGGEMLDAIASAPFLTFEEEAEDENEDLQGEHSVPDETQGESSEGEGRSRGGRRRRRKRGSDKQNKDRHATVEDDSFKTIEVDDDTTEQSSKEQTEPATDVDAELAEAVKAVVVTPTEPPHSEQQTMMTDEDAEAVGASPDSTIEYSEGDPALVATVDAVSSAAEITTEQTDGQEPPHDETPQVEELHSLHAATPSPEPGKRKRAGWWKRSGE